MASQGARVVAAFLAGRTAFGLAYLTAVARALPNAWYRPLEREWVFGAKPPGLAMEWFGRSLSSAIVAALVTAAIWLLSGRRPLAALLAKRPVVMAIAEAAGLVLLIDFSYFGWILLTQSANPLPLPPGCVP